MLCWTQCVPTSEKAIIVDPGVAGVGSPVCSVPSTTHFSAFFLRLAKSSAPERCQLMRMSVEDKIPHPFPSLHWVHWPARNQTPATSATAHNHIVASTSWDPAHDADPSTASMEASSAHRSRLFELNRSRSLSSLDALKMSDAMSHRVWLKFI